MHTQPKITTNSQPALAKSQKTQVRLTAKWLLIDGKLTCTWHYEH